MNTEARWRTFPIGAGMAEGPERWAEITELVDQTPRSILDMLAAPRTASFIRGLVKTYKLPPEKGQFIAYSVLQVALGEKVLTQLSSVLAAEAQLGQDVAKRMADEIEKDLFEPIGEVLTNYLADRLKSAPVRRREGSAETSVDTNNVLDLTQGKKPPAPPPMPGA